MKRHRPRFVRVRRQAWVRFQEPLLVIRERKAINVRFDGPRLLRRLALHLFRARLSPCRVHKRVAGIVALAAMVQRPAHAEAARVRQR